MTRISTITTADELLHTPGNMEPCELVRGELIMMTPAGFFHGRIEGNILAALSAFVREKDLGMVVTGDTGFLLERSPDTVRAPDVSFIRKARIPSVPPQGFFPGPPDLAVEIRSPDDKLKAIEAKIGDYLRLGVQVVWDVDPQQRTVAIHRTGEKPVILREDETVTEEELLPNFTLAVKEIFVW